MKLFETKTHKVYQDISGAQIEFKSYHLKPIDFKATKKVYLQSNVHGAEVQGNAVMAQLIQLLPKIGYSCEFIFVPKANPLSTNVKSGTYSQGRFNPITGHNWNRNYVNILEDKKPLQNLVSKIKKGDSKEDIDLLFKDFLKKSLQNKIEETKGYGLNQNGNINQILQMLAHDADIVLDLHTGPIACEYIYCPAYAVKSSKNFLFQNTISIPEEFAGAMDEACFTPWFELNKALQKSQIPYTPSFESFTLELGSEEVISKSLAKIQAYKILYFLHKKKLCDLPKDFYDVCKLPGKQNVSHLDNFKTYYAKHSGNIEYLVAPGEEFKKGDVLYSILNFNDLENLWTDRLAMSDGILINHSPSANIIEGMEVLQVLENLDTL